MTALADYAKLYIRPRIFRLEPTLGMSILAGSNQSIDAIALESAGKQVTPPYCQQRNFFGFTPQAIKAGGDQPTASNVDS